MSTGGKYIIESTTYAKQDEILLNRKLLDAKIKEQYCGPFLLGLNTHATFIKKYYKPIVPVAYEYRAEMAETGNLGFGTNRFSLQQYGDFTGAVVLSCRLSGLAALSPLDRCAYVDLLGHKLISKVVLEIGGNKIDEYTGEAYNVYYNYFVPEDKRAAWLHSVGQEVPEQVYVQQDDGDLYREQKNIVFGPQTPKPAHDTVQLNIPIIFDCFLRKTSSLFSAKIPFGLRFLYITLNPDIFYGIDGGGGGAITPPTITGNIIVENIFMDPQVVSALKTGTYRSLVRVFKENTYSVLPGETNIKLDQLRFPTEHIYFGVRPAVNTGPTDWWRFHSTNPLAATFPVRIPPNQLAFRTVNVFRPTTTITDIMFLTKNTEIVRRDKTEFYNCVQPLAKSRSPHDTGLLLYSFARDTHTDEPTGFYNISNEREFYIKFTAATTGTLYVMGYSLNWIEINETGITIIKYVSD